MNIKCRFGCGWDVPDGILMKGLRGECGVMRVPAVGRGSCVSAPQKLASDGRGNALSVFQES